MPGCGGKCPCVECTCGDDCKCGPGDAGCDPCASFQAEAAAAKLEGCQECEDQAAASTYQWTVEEVQSEGVTKKALIEYMYQVAPEALKEKYKINKSAAKKLSKEYAIAAYKEMLEGGGEVVVPQGAEGEQVEANVTAVAVSAAEEGVKKKKEKLYKKKIMKKGAGKESIPKKGTTVRCHYVGKLEDGTVFDLSLIHISEPTRLLSISYAVFCLKKKKKKTTSN
eukprot:TRINITY_DN2240_c0_g1_i4.p1 TRINITY_DN2240_c0_g1~~TRINITY_DN2240_c0_g1_i4.p1  ORF type:complete len:224 (-),score=75.47 TRINITY_DN2240_c0_g1_i4:38-709(-)